MCRHGKIQVPADFTSSSGIIAFLPGTSFSAFTDSEGKFSISGVPVGTYTVSFTATGLEQAISLLEQERQLLYHWLAYRKIHHFLLESSGKANLIL